MPPFELITNFFFTLLARNCPGMYALTVSGHLPEGIINGLKERGVVYGK